MSPAVFLSEPPDMCVLARRRSTAAAVRSMEGLVGVVAVEGGRMRSWWFIGRGDSASAHRVVRILSLALVAGLVMAVHLQADTAASSLPTGARYAISAAIGSDNAAYHATGTLAGTSFSNPGHGFELLFDAAGTTLQAGDATWRMGLVSWGYGDAVDAVAAGQVTAEGNRVEIDHGTLTEWYVNGPFGVQQGFTVAAAPGESSGAPLVLRLATPAGLTVRIDADGRGLTWCTADGAAVLRYSGLTVIDAHGESLPTWLETADGLLTVCVDDAGATYPLIIDPLIEDAKLTSTDGAAGDWFGWNVAIDGDTIVVGAMLHDSWRGRAYVFVKPAGGWWVDATETATLIASDGTANDQFGASVAIDGDTIVVGASTHDIPGGNDNQGAAYVYVKPVGGWTGTLTEDAKLIASDGAAGDNAGGGVAIDGDTVVVDAAFHTVGGNARQGAAYVFVEPVGGWTGTLTETAKLTASDGGTNHYFGRGGVGIDGDTIAVGSRGHSSNRGAAYIYIKPVGGWATATEDAQMTSSDGAAGDEFGATLAIDGDTVLIGAWRDNSDRGSAYIFVRPGGGWTGALTEDAKLISSSGAADDYLGVSVDIDGDFAIVGARGQNSDEGEAYVFVKPGGGWTGTLSEDDILTASDGEAGDYFGAAVAIHEETLVVGAYRHQTGGDDDRGAVYVFFEQPEPGDINADEVVDVLDARLCLQIVSGCLDASDIQRKVADVDGDGDVDMDDAIIMAEYVIGITDTLP